MFLDLLWVACLCFITSFCCGQFAVVFCGPVSVVLLFVVVAGVGFECLVATR